MKLRSILFLLTMLCGVHTGFGAQLHITLTNLKKAATIYIAVYNKASDFGNPHKAYKKVVLKPAPGNTQSVTVTDLPTGDYAIAVYHDYNENRKIDKNLFGIPTEPFAFSNNVRPVVSAPSFKDCLIKLGDKDLSVSIKLMTYL